MRTARKAEREELVTCALSSLAQLRSHLVCTLTGAPKPTLLPLRVDAHADAVPATIHLATARAVTIAAPYVREAQQEKKFMRSRVGLTGSSSLPIIPAGVLPPIALATASSTARSYRPQRVELEQFITAQQVNQVLPSYIR
jgi:hypothetical protein